VQCIFGLWRWLEQLHPRNVFVGLNQSKLEDYLNGDDDKLRRLKAAFGAKYQFVAEHLMALPDAESVRRAVQAQVREFAAKMGDEGSVFAVRERYYRLLRLLTSDLFPFSNAIAASRDKFFELEPKLFLGLLFDLITAMATVLEIKPTEMRTLNLVVYRIVFDSIFTRQDFLTPKAELLKRLEWVTVGELRLPIEFCPPRTEAAMAPRAVFRADPHFGTAVRELESICFFTNPRDILHCVPTAIKATEAAATHYSGGTVLFFPFEVAFGLFVGVVLSADIPELEAIARFVQQYTPKSRLGTVLEYAKSNLVAAALHCQELAATHP
jgi:hypothetical protein